MTESTNEPGPTEGVTLTRVTDHPAHNRRKVYVNGTGGVRVPFIEVALSDSPASDGARPNPPVTLYDTSGPGSVPTEGLPPLRLPWIAAAGMWSSTGAVRPPGATTAAPRCAGPSPIRRASPRPAAGRCGPQEDRSPNCTTPGGAR